jgi:hypothetical protein
MLENPMKKINIFLFIPLFMVIGSGPAGNCEAGFLQKNVTWIVDGGVYHGSIVGRNKVDAVSGATKTSFAGSAAAEFNVAGHYVSAGVNIAQSGQHIDYKDTANGITGERDISLLLLDLPLLYNFHMFKKPSGGRDNPRLIIGLGAFVSFVLSKHIEQNGSVPSASLSLWTMGPYMRIAGYPFSFGRFQPGLYLDFYRSFVPKVYDEIYFRQNSIAGQLGIMNFGLSLRI